VSGGCERKHRTGVDYLIDLPPEELADDVRHAGLNGNTGGVRQWTSSLGGKPA
jgi:hypothetical protein